MANPTGKNGSDSKGRPLADLLRMELFKNDRAKLRMLVSGVIERAMNGEPWAAQLVFDRIDGKVPQPVGGSDELGPQKLQIEWKLSAVNELPAPQNIGALAAETSLQLGTRKPTAQLVDLSTERADRQPAE